MVRKKRVTMSIATWDQVCPLRLKVPARMVSKVFRLAKKVETVSLRVAKKNAHRNKTIFQRSVRARKTKILNNLLTKNQCHCRKKTQKLDYRSLRD